MEIDNPGNGNCLFYAVSLGMRHHKGVKTTPIQWKKATRELRSQVADEIKRLADTNKHFRNGLVGSEMNFNSNTNTNVNVSVSVASYLRRMRKDCTWGGQPETIATHYLLQRLGYQGLVVYQRNENSNSGYKRIADMSGRLNHSKPLPPIKIVLHGVNQLGIHYTTLL